MKEVGVQLHLFYIPNDKHYSLEFKLLQLIFKKLRMWVMWLIPDFIQVLNTRGGNNLQRQQGFSPL